MLAAEATKDCTPREGQRPLRRVDKAFLLSFFCMVRRCSRNTCVKDSFSTERLRDGDVQGNIGGDEHFLLICLFRWV